MTTGFLVQQPRRQVAMRRNAYGRWLTEAGDVTVEFYHTPSGYLVRFCGTADFAISRKDWSVSCYPALGDQTKSLDDLYLNQVAPLILSHHGATILHASAAASPQGALAFVGGTGRGKSTLAAGFAKAGHAFMSDDGLVVERNGAHWLARPNRPFFRFFSDSREAFAGTGTVCEPGEFDAKNRVEASDQLPFHEVPEPLCAIYFLGCDEVDSVRIEPLRMSDALARLVEHSFILDAEDRTRIRAHFIEMAELAETALCFSLDYPRQYDALPSTITEIIAHAAIARSDS
jgi:hypothetical protein